MTSKIKYQSLKTPYLNRADLFVDCCQHNVAIDTTTENNVVVDATGRGGDISLTAVIGLTSLTLFLLIIDCNSIMQLFNHSRRQL
jgi:hypothetical protein